ncbi:MAG: CoA transferase [Hyphomonadaceae bacterium]
MQLLAGTRILELCHAPSAPGVRLAASLAGKIAADLGAEVLKIEPPEGDCVRRMPPFLGDGKKEPRSALFEFLNTGKTIARRAADEKRAPASEAFDLIVLEENEPARAAMEKAGASIVEIAMTPKDAPWGARLSEFNILALSGLLDMVGDPARAPLRLGGHQAAYAAGLSAFSALMAALALREGGRAPPPARVSLLETMIWVNWKAAAGAFDSGRSPTRQGPKADFQVLACKDGWIAVIYTLTQFDNLAALVGDPELLTQFGDRRARKAGAEALFARLAPWFAARTREEIYAAARAAGVPLGPIYAPAELLEDAQYQARGFIVALEEGLAAPRLPALWNGQAFLPRRRREIPFEEALTWRAQP